ncbi:MAG: mutT/nudix family protein [Patescibacteria group bacterium]|nr:mutT/nudix family protein [Patescibacteria group bacterium]
MLNVVSEAGDIIGTETRAKIHRDGLLHREVNVWLYTGRGELIFQHRAPDKDTFPDMLDASVGGHVELGMDWLDAAVAELHEEAGLAVKPEELQFLRQNRVDFQDAATGAHNRALQNIYAYRYDGDVKDLQVEQGKAMGFEIWPIKDLYDLSPEQAKRFIFSLMKPSYLDVFHQIESLIASEAAATSLGSPHGHSKKPTPPTSAAMSQINKGHTMSLETVTKEYTVMTLVLTKGQPVKVLLLHSVRHDLWMPPGGHVEPGENPVETAIREVQEETQLDIAPYLPPATKIDDRSTVLPTPRRLVEVKIPAKGGQPEHFHLDLLYIAFIPEQVVVKDDYETSDIGWFTLEEAGQLKMPGDIRVLLREEMTK